MSAKLFNFNFVSAKQFEWREKKMLTKMLSACMRQVVKNFNNLTGTLQS